MKKICNECGIEKSVSEFHKQKTCKYGVRNKCKVCAIARTKACRDKDPEGYILKKREYNRANKERHSEYLAEYRARPGKRELINKLRNKWNKENFPRYKENQARNLIASRICPHKARIAWADRQYMRDLYGNTKEANEIFEAVGISPEFQVDHIVPLTHSLVSGLHNEFNLQVLTKLDNVKKHNHFNIG